MVRSSHAVAVPAGPPAFAGLRVEHTRETTMTESTSTTAVETPAVEQTTKAARKPRTKHAKATKRVRAGWKLGTPKRADGTTGTNECLCGCETLVKNRFAQGHDARVHSWLLKVDDETMALSELPAITRRALEAGVLVSHGNKAGRVLTGKQRRAAKPAKREQAAA